MTSLALRSKAVAYTALTGLVLYGMCPTQAFASPPGMGGGGGSWNWGSAAITALRGAQAIQEMRNAQGNNGSGAARGNLGPRKNNNVPQNNLVAPRNNVLPQKNVIVVQPHPNGGPAQHVVVLTNEDLARIKSELKDQNLALVNDLGRQVSAAVGSLIDKLPGAKNLTAEERTQLVNAIETGNPAAVSNLLPQGDRNTPTGRDLTNIATVRQLIDEIRTAVNNGTVNLGTLINIANAAAGTLPPDALINIGQIAVNQQITIWVTGAQPGPAVIPPGNNVPIALIPGLTAGQIIPLGGVGPVLVGMGGGDGTRILLGEGNVLQAAGLPAPIGAPTSDYAGDPVVNTVTLSNEGSDPINYNVNRYPYDMKPQFAQTLGAGKWLVEFDRGGGFGTEGYTLTEGFYEFTPTDKGWDLFKASFTATLENANDFDFHYVLDNQQFFLAPGKSTEFTGALPFLIRYENGNGEFAKKLLKNGTFKVAVTDKVALDIFPGEAVAMPKREPAAVGSVTSKTDVGLTSLDPASSAGNFTLPAGFRPIDPVALLTASKDKPEVAAQRLPAAFSLFADGAK